MRVLFFVVAASVFFLLLHVPFVLCCMLGLNRLPGSVNVAKVLACVVAGLAPLDQGATRNVINVILLRVSRQLL